MLAKWRLPLLERADDLSVVPMLCAAQMCATCALLFLKASSSCGLVRTDNEGSLTNIATTIVITCSCSLTITLGQSFKGSPHDPRRLARSGSPTEDGREGGPLGKACNVGEGITGKSTDSYQCINAWHLSELCAHGIPPGILRGSPHGKWELKSHENAARPVGYQVGVTVGRAKSLAREWRAILRAA